MLVQHMCCRKLYSNLVLQQGKAERGTAAFSFSNRASSCEQAAVMDMMVTQQTHMPYVRAPKARTLLKA